MERGSPRGEGSPKGGVGYNGRKSKERGKISIIIVKTLKN